MHCVTLGFYKRCGQPSVECDIQAIQNPCDGGDLSFRIGAVVGKREIFGLPSLVSGRSHKGLPGKYGIQVELCNGSMLLWRLSRKAPRPMKWQQRYEKGKPSSKAMSGTLRVVIIEPSRRN